MSNLEPLADKAVHDAVDAFMEGRLNPEFAGETVFETKNSRYRLLDGVVFAAPDERLIGAELVGWLMETTRRSVVGSAWQPGARAVLVDRHRGRNIIVTSTTRLLHLEEHASSDSVTMAEPSRPVTPATRWASGPGWVPPAEPAAPQRPRIIPSTPPPPQVIPPASLPVAALPRSSPVQSAAMLQKRAAAVHLPPRPIAQASPTPYPVPVPARPLPAPAPPPRRDALPWGEPPAQPLQPPPSAQVNPSLQPLAGTPWELTSSEFEIDVDGSGDLFPGDDPLRYDASHYGASESIDASTDEILAGPESGGDAPILLVRPITPGTPGGPRSPT